MGHNHTILGQMLQMFLRFEFQKAVKETKTEYHARGFRSWNHFISMLFCQLSGQDSLRGIEAGLASQSQSLYHLGVRPVHRSTLSYTNTHRSHELFKKIFVWYTSLCDRNIYFVNRLKKNADYRVIERRSTTHLKNISSDHIIELKGFYTKKKCPYRLRRIRSYDPDTGKWIVLLTNQFEWSANTIAKVYKDRWQIKLFFRALKQHLKVKSFVGTSRNALLFQLLVALIAYLRLCYLKFKSRFCWSLYILSSILPTNLIERRNPWDWLNSSYHSQSNAPPGMLQYELSLG